MLFQILPIGANANQSSKFQVNQYSVSNNPAYTSGSGTPTGSGTQLYANWRLYGLYPYQADLCGTSQRPCQTSSHWHYLVKSYAKTAQQRQHSAPVARKVEHLP